MEDLYDNLENYEDLDKIDELKNENKELKCKIEEYTKAIERLQKNILQDFDKLATEHKKLERNYSSLLKTAKAEIERKTEMIKELNIQKDKLVLDSRQNMGKNIFNKFRRSERLMSKHEKGLDSGVQEQSDVLNSKNKMLQNERKKNNHLPSSDSVSNCSAEAKVVSDVEKYSGNKNNNHNIKNHTTKENDMQILNSNIETRLMRISNRRKSMPALSHDIRFSSDEECENNSVPTGENKIYYPKRDEIVNRFAEKNYHSNKMSETSSIENNYSHYNEPLQGNYTKNNTCRYYNDDKYRRDKFESSQRNRWHVSPDRSYRGARDYTEDYHQRYDYKKRKAYESPPREKSYHRNRSRDRRSNYERDYPQNFVRHWNDNERYGENHKHQDDMDEPNYKRQKFEHSHRHTVDDNRWHEEMDVSKRLGSTPLELTERISCQSPDYVHIVNHTAPIMEIRNTAVMHLEDPRLSSKKYKLINDNDKEVLSTVIGRNINIVPINTTCWALEKVPMPKALLKPPSPYTEKLAKDHVYVDIDNPTYNVATSAGEISGEDDYNYTSSFTTEHRQFENEKCQNYDNDYNTNFNIQEECSKISAKPLGTKCNIPKLQNTPEVIKRKIEKVSNYNNVDLEVDIKSNITMEETDKENPENAVKIKSMPQINIHSKSSLDIKTVSDDKEKRNDSDTTVAECITKCNDHDFALSTRIVENDLILSDETSDITEPQIKIVKKQSKPKSKKDNIEVCNEKQKCKVELNKDVIHKDTANAVDNKGRQSSTVKGQIKLIETTTEEGKRHKNKKLSQENKGSRVVQPKLSKSKKNKKEKESKTHEVKTKFSDLFGDSSSLITPDDLGIVAPETELGGKYSTLFEDTQDAVDLNIKEIEKVETEKPKCGDFQNKSVKEQLKLIETRSSKTKSDSSSIKDSKKDEKLQGNIQILKIAEEKCTVKDTTDVIDVHKNINIEPSSIVKTMIISTGIQPQNLSDKVLEFTEPLDIIPFVETVKKPIINLALKALATSTPAKMTQQELSQSDLTTKIQDCPSANSTESRNVDSSQTVDQSSKAQVDSQKDIDVPDVRIFVKRRKKVKRMTP